MRPGTRVADGRKMRTLFAEDPEWSLALVPSLTTLCLQHIIKHFEGKQYKYSLSFSLFIHITHYHKFKLQIHSIYRTKRTKNLNTH